MGVQPMRTTQLIFNHGPGSILETVDGPAVVRTWDCLEESIEIQSRGFPLAFEISETRLTNLLAAPNNSRARLHRIPSNVELSKNDNWFSIMYINWYFPIYFLSDTPLFSGLSTL